MDKIRTGSIHHAVNVTPQTSSAIRKRQVKHLLGKAQSSNNSVLPEFHLSVFHHIHLICLSNLS